MFSVTVEPAYPTACAVAPDTLGAFAEWWVLRQLLCSVCPTHALVLTLSSALPPIPVFSFFWSHTITKLHGSFLGFSSDVL